MQNSSISCSITVPKLFSFLCTLKKRTKKKKEIKKKRKTTKLAHLSRMNPMQVKKNHKNNKNIYIFNSHLIKYLTSARRVILLLSGQIIWSTWERTFSHVKSGVLRLLWNAIWCKYGTKNIINQFRRTKQFYKTGSYMRRFARFGAICTTLKMWKTHMEECYFAGFSLQLY